jgi:hypothetical protein
MKDAIAVYKLRRRLGSISPIHSSVSMRYTVRHLDLGSLVEEEQARIANSVLLGMHSMPFERIVIPDMGKLVHYRVFQKLCDGYG